MGVSSQSPWLVSPSPAGLKIPALPSVGGEKGGSAAGRLFVLPAKRSLQYNAGLCAKKAAWLLGPSISADTAVTPTGIPYCGLPPATNHHSQTSPHVRRRYGGRMQNLRNHRILGVLLLLGVLLCAEAARTFKAPATAVVDIARVFDLYEKKKDRQGELQTEIKVVEDKHKELEKKYKDLVAELPNLEAGTRKNDLMLQKLKLEMDLKDLRETELKRLRETHLKYLQELKVEIMAEIEAYAKAQDVDMVLEKVLTLDSEGTGPGSRWPIVHFAKPEFEITDEIAERLNSRYRKAP
jgi:Skp family chaperone for outer membrane proteins